MKADGFQDCLEDTAVADVVDLDEVAEDDNAIRNILFGTKNFPIKHN